MNRYADCSYCGGEVVEQTIEYDYRRQKHLMVVSNEASLRVRSCNDTSGCIWRYNPILCQNDEYLLQLIRYTSQSGARRHGQKSGALSLLG